MSWRWTKVDTLGVLWLALLGTSFYLYLHDNGAAWLLFGILSMVTFVIQHRMKKRSLVERAGTPEKNNG